MSEYDGNCLFLITLKYIMLDIVLLYLLNFLKVDTGFKKNCFVRQKVFYFFLETKTSASGLWQSEEVQGF